MTKVVSMVGGAFVCAVWLSGLVPAVPTRDGAVTPDGEQQTGSQWSAAEPAAPSAFTETLIHDLTALGFQVNPGYPLVYANACKDYSYPALQSCFGNNPVGPYVVAAVKPWPEERFGPTPVDAFGPVRSGYIPTYRLEPRDAVLIYGQMPPPGKYMSVTTNDWSQHGAWKAKDYDYWANIPNHPPMRYVFSTIPANDRQSERIWSFSSIGDSVNNVVMQRKSGDPFGKARYFIITPSASTDMAVRRVLQAQGVHDDHIFTEQIPSRDDAGPIGPLGMGENAMDFLTFFRYVLPDDQAAATQWWTSLGGLNPALTVMRVRAPSSLGPVQRYGLLKYDERTAYSEKYLRPDLDNLVHAVCGRVESSVNLSSADCTQPPPATSLLADLLPDFGWAGPYCRKTHLWCGDQPDAGLYGTRLLSLNSGEVHALVGTLATETGNATYVGVSVNNASTYLAPTGITDADLKGSAVGYQGTVSNTGKFFVHYFARHCGDLITANTVDRAQDCTEISETMVPEAGDPDAQGDRSLFGMFWLGIRDYIAQGTARGPDTTKLLRPRILTFTPR